MVNKTTSLVDKPGDNASVNRDDGEGGKYDCYVKQDVTFQFLVYHNVCLIPREFGQGIWIC